MFDASFPEGWWALLPILPCRHPDRRGHRHHRRSCPAHALSADGLPDLSSRRRGRARQGRRDRVQRSDRRAHLQHQCHHREQEGFEEEREWSRSFWSALQPHHTGVYVNFLMEEGQQRIRDAYGIGKYDRLRTLKRRYDPDNFFRMNQNIPHQPDPGAAGGEAMRQDIEFDAEV